MVYRQSVARHSELRRDSCRFSPLASSDQPAGERRSRLLPRRKAVDGQYVVQMFDELKTHLRGARIVLRSKTPDLVRQEFYGLLMAHFAVLGLMHEAALKADEDPDRLSFLHAVRIVRRKLHVYGAIDRKSVV